MLFFLSGQALLSVWVSCYQSCRLGITYQTSERKIRDVSFHHIGKISNHKWHSIALHIFPHSHAEKTEVDLYVDCKMLNRKKLLTKIEDFVPSSTGNPQDTVFLFAQRSGYKNSVMLTWKVKWSPHTIRRGTQRNISVKYLFGQKVA